MNLIFAALVFFWGVGSLLLIAIKTKSIKTMLLKKPSIIIGDFFILPLIGGLIGTSYQEKGLEANFFTWLALIVSFTLTVISALRNKLTHPLWIPHLVFYWFMAFIILNYLSSFKFNVSWWLVLAGAIFHQSSGIMFPKKFPQIGKT